MPKLAPKVFPFLSFPLSFQCQALFFRRRYMPHLSRPNSSGNQISNWESNYNFPHACISWNITIFQWQNLSLDVGVHLGGRGEVPLPDANADLGHLQAGINVKKRNSISMCYTIFVSNGCLTKGKRPGFGRWHDTAFGSQTHVFQPGYDNRTVLAQRGYFCQKDPNTVCVMCGKLNSGGEISPL